MHSDIAKTGQNDGFKTGGSTARAYKRSKALGAEDRMVERKASSHRAYLSVSFMEGHTRRTNACLQGQPTHKKLSITLYHIFGDSSMQERNVVRNL